MASSFIDCKNIVGCHYDTFPIIEIDQNAAQSAFKSAGIDLQLPGVGETITI
jgi:L-ascorbate metabolism protein UlaG (beta-lactamase superfamily)